MTKINENITIAVRAAEQIFKAKKVQPFAAHVRRVIQKPYGLTDQSTAFALE